MYTTRGCTPGVPTVYPYPQYPWLTQPEGRRVRVLTGTGTGQPGITRGLPVLIPICNSVPLKLRDTSSSRRGRNTQVEAKSLPLLVLLRPLQLFRLYLRLPLNVVVP